MGASLLAKAVYQSTLMLNVTPSSRAGSLPQSDAPDLLRDATRRGGDAGHLPFFAPHIAQDIGFIHGLAGAFRRRGSDRWRWRRTGTAAEDRHAQCQRQG
ncbi:hypothetical protein EMIT0P74_20232 [Pseudomonas sp. IT-P74]